MGEELFHFFSWEEKGLALAGKEAEKPDSEQILEIENEISGRLLAEQEPRVIVRRVHERFYERPRRYDEEY